MESEKLITVTNLSAYAFCQRGLYLKLVKKLREPVKPVMILGSIRHQIYDEANKNEERLVKQISSDLNREQILKLFANTYSGFLHKSIYGYTSKLASMKMDANTVSLEMQPAVLSQAHARADEILSFSSKAKLFGQELWTALTPKIITELSVSSKRLHLKGIVDRVEVYGNEYVPAEIKTGRVPSEGVWPDHRLQLSAYMLLLKDKFNVNIKEGVVKYVATNQTRQGSMNPFMEYEVTSAVQNVFALMERKDIPDFCGKKYCSICILGNDYERHLIKLAYTVKNSQ